ncbi:unnamed protein product [Lampetra fluviatilis]
MAPRNAAAALPLFVAAGSASLLLGLAACGSLAQFLYAGPPNINNNNIINNNINNIINNNNPSAGERSRGWLPWSILVTLCGDVSICVVLVWSVYFSLCAADGDVDALRWRDVRWGLDSLWPLLFDLGLAVSFLLLHRAMASPWAQRVLAATCGVCRRAVHVICTAVTVQLLIHLWEPGRALPPLWSVRGELAHSTCFLVHVLSWLVMLSIAIIFDFPELMGIKQMYYEVMGLGEPMLLKSRRAQRLYGHMRVPVFVEALLVLWVVPRMSAERALLSLLASAYLATVHRLDGCDYEYLRGQLARKFEVFRHEERRLGRLGDGEGDSG